MLALGPLELHKMLDGFEDKSTQAVCTFAYCEGPGHEPIIFQGRTDVSLRLQLVVVQVVDPFAGQASAISRINCLRSVLDLAG